MTGPLRSAAESVIVAVHAKPGSKRDAVGGLHDGRLCVRTKAVAEGGRANLALGALVATAFGLPRSAVTLVAGGSGRRKEFALTGLTLEEALRRLASHEDTAEGGEGRSAARLSRLA